MLENYDKPKRLSVNYLCRGRFFRDFQKGQYGQRKIQIYIRDGRSAIFLAA